jgi:hypothetical protein
MEDETKTEPPVTVMRTTGSRLHALAKAFPARDAGLDDWIMAGLPDIVFRLVVSSCESRASEGFFLDRFDMTIDELANRTSELNEGMPASDVDMDTWQDHRQACERILPRLVDMVERRLFADGFGVHAIIHPNRLTFDLDWT